MIKIFITFYLLVFIQISFPQEYDQYFPNKIFSENVKNDEFKVKWYSQHLVSMNEPSLWKLIKSPTKEIYRLLWLRTFDSPVVIRLEINTDSAKLFVKRTNGLGGYNAGSLIDDFKYEISKDSISNFIDLLRSSNFWKLSANKQLFLGTDGSRWIVEGIKNGKYHLVDRYCGDEIKELGLFLLSMSKLDYGEIY